MVSADGCKLPNWRVVKFIRAALRHAFTSLEPKCYWWHHAAPVAELGRFPFILGQVRGFAATNRGTPSVNVLGEDFYLTMRYLPFHA